MFGANKSSFRVVERVLERNNVLEYFDIVSYMHRDPYKFYN